MNWILFIIVFLLCLPGIYFMYQSEKIHVKEQDITDGQRIIGHLLTALIFSALGAFTVNKIQLGVNEIAVYGLGLGAICSLVHMLFYYAYLVPNITKNDYVEIEAHYANTGILSRVFYGGVMEEIIFRWGMLSLIIWLLQLMKMNELYSTLIAITCSSILFAIVHLPSIKLVASDPKPPMYIYTLVGNMWVGICTGIAFIQAGLLAAIIVHMLFHLLWWPVQLRKKIEGASKN